MGGMTSGVDGVVDQSGSSGEGEDGGAETRRAQGYVGEGSGVGG